MYSFLRVGFNPRVSLQQPLLHSSLLRHHTLGNYSLQAPFIFGHHNIIIFLTSYVGLRPDADMESVFIQPSHLLQTFLQMVNVSDRVCISTLAKRKTMVVRIMFFFFFLSRNKFTQLESNCLFDRIQLCQFGLFLGLREKRHCFKYQFTVL